MGLILSIETSTKACSVSLAKNGQEILTKDFYSDQFSHAEKVNVFIDEIMNKSDLSLNALDAIAVSEGPGSYTGLRIGTSTAKGICYALNIPLIAVNSLKALASLEPDHTDFTCPMFDARRDEVYSAVFDSDMKLLQETKAIIVDSLSYLEFLEIGKVTFLGPGAEKCQALIQHQNANFDLQTKVSAKGMNALSEEKFQSGNFVDLAYFEPFYLKDFIAGAPKKLL